MKIMLHYAWLLVLIYLPEVTLSYETDKITSLPGQPPVSFHQYAGYISVDETQKRYLFYYFLEAQTIPSSKPLVLWLNGGPGCSSIGGGAFTENGPFRPSENVLVNNDFSWNKDANMLYLETPAGVGFSYSTNKSYYDQLNDEMIARDNLVFLQKWLEKYPKYKNRDLFLTGESYAGHYIPQLANAILKTSLKTNLKGIAIGNPLLDFNIDCNSRMEYFWSHGIVSDDTYQFSEKYCNYSQVTRQALKGNFSSFSPACAHVYNLTKFEIRNINQYDVTLDVCIHPVYQQAHFLSQMGEEKIDVCILDESNEYLNRKDVQKAMNARMTEWSLCNDNISDTYNRDDLQAPTIQLLGTLIKNGVRVLIYSGDQDSVIPLTGSRLQVNRLAKELGLKTTVPYSSWLSDEQVGGWTEVYGDNLAFATVRGASHLVPYSQPARALVLFRSFLDGKPLPAASVA